MRCAQKTIRAGTSAHTHAHAESRERKQSRHDVKGQSSASRGGVGSQYDGGGVNLVTRARELRAFIPAKLELAAGGSAAYGRHGIKRAKLEETPRRMSGGCRGSEAQSRSPAS